jgi:hypothetical protein
MYAAASQNSTQQGGKIKSHRELISGFTGHLVDEEFEYFNKWDMLIDLEADASSSFIARTWLQESKDLENEFSTCVSSMVFDESQSSRKAAIDDSSFAIIGYKRCPTSPIQTPLSKVGFGPGCRIVVGTDSTTIQSSTGSHNVNNCGARSQMYIVRGTIHKVSETHLFILTSCDDLDRMERFLKTSMNKTATFRIDKENFPTGITTLRQNLVNLLSADKKTTNAPPGSQIKPSRLSRLREILIRLHEPNFDKSLVQSMFATNTDPVPGCNMMDLRREFSELNRDQQLAVEKVRPKSSNTSICDHCPSACFTPLRI